MTGQVTPRFKQPAPPPKRRAHNSTLPAASEPINPISERQRGIESDYVEQKRLVHARSGRRCEMPDGHHAPGCRGFAQEVHHALIPRSLGRDDSLSNLRDLSIPCHVQAELHPPFYRDLFAANPLCE